MSEHQEKPQIPEQKEAPKEPETLKQQTQSRIEQVKKDTSKLRPKENMEEAKATPKAQEEAAEKTRTLYADAEMKAASQPIPNDIELQNPTIDASMGYVPYLEHLLTEVADHDEWFGDSAEEAMREQALLQGVVGQIQSNLEGLGKAADAATGTPKGESLRKLFIERSARLAELIGNVDEQFENTEVRNPEMMIKQAAETIRRMTPEEGIEWVTKMMATIDGNNWQSRGLAETYANLTQTCKQGLQVKLAEEKAQEMEDPKKMKSYIGHCMELARLFTDRGSPIDSNLTDLDFAVDMAREGMDFQNLALRYMEQKMQKKNAARSYIETHGVTVLEKLQSLPAATLQKPEVQAMMKTILAPPVSIQQMAAQYAIIRNLEAQLSGGGTVNIEAELNGMLMTDLETAMGAFDTFLNGGLTGATGLEQINAAIGSPPLSAEQMEAWTLLSDLRGYGYDIGDYAWSWVGAGAKVSAMIGTGIAVGVATGGLGIVAGALAGGAAMTASNAVINQQGFDSATDALDVYGKDFAINTTTMGASRYLTAGRAAYQLSRSGMLQQAGGLKGLLTLAQQKGGLVVINSLDDASSIGTRLTGAVLEGSADSVIGATLDTTVQGGTFLDNLKNNAMFAGLGGAEFVGPAIRKLRGLPQHELRGLAELVNRAGTQKTKLSEQCHGLSLDPKKLLQAEDPASFLRQAGMGEEKIKAALADITEMKQIQNQFQTAMQRATAAPEAFAKNTLPPEDASRIQDAMQTLGEPLTASQQKTVLDAHNVGAGEPGLDGSPARVGNYTPAQLKKKAEILKNVEFTPEQRRVLMEAGIVGLVSPQVAKKAPEALHFLNGKEKIAALDKIRNSFKSLLSRIEWDNFISLGNRLTICRAGNENTRIIWLISEAGSWRKEINPHSKTFAYLKQPNHPHLQKCEEVLAQAFTEARTFFPSDQKKLQSGIIVEGSTNFGMEVGNEAGGIRVGAGTTNALLESLEAGKDIGEIRDYIRGEFAHEMTHELREEGGPQLATSTEIEVASHCVQFLVTEGKSSIFNKQLNEAIAHRDQPRHHYDSAQVASLQVLHQKLKALSNQGLCKTPKNYDVGSLRESLESIPHDQRSQIIRSMVKEIVNTSAEDLMITSKAAPPLKSNNSTIDMPGFGKVELTEGRKVQLEKPGKSTLGTEIPPGEYEVRYVKDGKNTVISLKPLNSKDTGGNYAVDLGHTELRAVVPTPPAPPPLRSLEEHLASPDLNMKYQDLLAGLRVDRLTKEQQKAIMDAHHFQAPETRPKGQETVYSASEIATKARMLKDAGFTEAQRAYLIRETGITGSVELFKKATERTKLQAREVVERAPSVENASTHIAVEQARKVQFPQDAVDILSTLEFRSQRQLDEFAKNVDSAILRTIKSGDVILGPNDRIILQTKKGLSLFESAEDLMARERPSRMKKPGEVLAVLSNGRVLTTRRSGGKHEYALADEKELVSIRENYKQNRNPVELLLDNPKRYIGGHIIRFLQLGVGKGMMNDFITFGRSRSVLLQKQGAPIMRGYLPFLQTRQRRQTLVMHLAPSINDAHQAADVASGLREMHKNLAAVRAQGYRYILAPIMSEKIQELTTSRVTQRLMPFKELTPEIAEDLFLPMQPHRMERDNFRIMQELGLLAPGDAALEHPTYYILDIDQVLQSREQKTVKDHKNTAA